MNRQQVHLEHFRGNEEFVKRMYDLIDLASRRQRVIITPFFSPDQTLLCERICGNQIQYQKSGGYAHAERVRFAFIPFEEEVEFPIVILKATYASTFGLLTHRDVLGAFMHVGIEREKMGDILVNDHEIYCIIDQEIENYIVCNLTKIKRTSIHFAPCNKVEAIPTTLSYAHRIVSSLRLDAIIASLAHVSRAKAQSLIVAGCVKVDHVVLEQTSYLCNNNSTISIRGVGRFHFAEVIKRTKKDHYVIAIGVYE